MPEDEEELIAGLWVSFCDGFNVSSATVGGGEVACDAKVGFVVVSLILGRTVGLFGS